MFKLLITVGKKHDDNTIYCFGNISAVDLNAISNSVSSKNTKGKHLTGLNKRLKILEGKKSKGLVYFFSPSCHACKSQTPIIKSIQSKNRNVFDVDISRDLDTARKFGVKATPTTVAVEGGVITQVFLGIKNREILEKYL